MRKAIRNLNAVLLPSTLAVLCGPVATSAQEIAAESDLAAIEAFVEQSAERTELPADSDQRLSDLRRFCFSEDGKEYRARTGRGAESYALALWVLSRYEYTALISAFSGSAAPLSQVAAAWRLERAVQELLTYSVATGLANQESWALRLLRARSYPEEAQELIPRQLTARDAEALVAQQLTEVFSPNSGDPINRDLQAAFRNAVLTAEETLLAAVKARHQAIDGLRMIYGRDPEARQAENRGHLSEAERQGFFADELYPRIRELVGEPKSDGQPAAPQGEDDHSILDRYVELRRKLALGEDPAPDVDPAGRPSPPVVQAVFDNDRRENAATKAPSLERIRNTIATELEIGLPDPIDAEDAIGGYDRAIEELTRRLQTPAAGGDRGDREGKREQAELDRLREVFPESPGERTKPVPWFGTMRRDDLKRLDAETSPWLDRKDFEKRLDDRLRDEATRYGLSAELLKNLLAGLERQIASEETEDGP